MNAIVRILTLSCSIVSLVGQVDDNQNTRPSRDSSRAMQVVEAGPNHRTVVLRNERGEITSQYQQIQTGLMRQVDDGSWVETSTEIELFEDGAIARKTGHQVIFSPDSSDANGVFDVLMPNGKRLRGRCVGLAYTDPKTGDSVFVAEAKSVVGELVGHDEVIYRDCFVGDIQGDIRYRNTFSGLVQDVILRSKVPSPDLYGLPNDVTLEVWTHFMDAPGAARSEHRRFTRAGREVRDTFIDFGVMSIGPGRAFPIANEHPIQRNLGRQISVHKAYERIDGMQFLIEMVPYQEVAQQLAELPDPPHAARLDKTEISEALASVRGEKKQQFAAEADERIAKHRPLSIFPPSQKATAGLKIKRKALEGVQLAGYVLDFDLNGGTITNYTFRSDTTYYVTGTVYLNGATTIEGGTVIKFANTNTPQLIINVSGSLQMHTDEYNRAMFIAKDDNSVGAIIAGSTGTPSGIYAQTAIGYASSTPMSISNFHIRNADFAIYLGDNMGAVSNSVSHAQFVNCDKTIVVSGTHLRVRNSLFNNCTRAFWCVGAVYRCEHITFNQLTALAQNWGGSSFAITNSIFCNVGSIPSITSANNVTTNNEAVFEQTGAGEHYLPVSSPLRDAGTTLINPSLAADLKRFTTYSPVVLNADVATNTTLSRAVSRDVDTPDIGYHYPAIDYLFGNLNVTNALLLLTNGVAVAFHGTNGVTLGNGSSFLSHGSPDLLNTMVRYQQVQENLSTNLGGPKAAEMSLVKVEAPDWDPEVRVKFSRANFFADDPGVRHLVLGFTGSELISNYSVESSQFVNSYHSHHSLVSTGAYGIAFTNNIFGRSQLIFYQTNTAGYYDFPLSFYNNTLNGGESLFYYGTSGATWSVKDNFFNETTVSNSVGTVDASYNGYRNAAPGLGGTNNVSVTIADYASGPLGRFYYPTSGTNISSLINAGSRSARLAGLFHFTTGSAAYSREGSTTVDIGFHYVGVGGDGLPSDTDTDFIPDFLEDENGNGTTDTGETSYKVFSNPSAPWLSVFPLFD